MVFGVVDADVEGKTQDPLPFTRLIAGEQEFVPSLTVTVPVGVPMVVVFTCTVTV